MSEYDHQLLDDVIHSRIRTAIMALLAGVQAADFTHLREQVGTTDGNLATHMRKLQESGYVEAHKSFVDGKPRTRYKLTARGRTALLRYVDQLQRMLESSDQGGA
jgi:predicted ArsR family transcriptional regulator